MDFLTLMDYLIRGLSLGSIYAIIALGSTMVCLLYTSRKPDDDVTNYPE